MANTVNIKLTVPKGDVDEIDQLVSEGKFASRADFGHKAVYLLLSSINGTLSDVRKNVQNEDEKGKSTS